MTVTIQCESEHCSSIFLQGPNLGLALSAACGFCVDPRRAKFDGLSVKVECYADDLPAAALDPEWWKGFQHRLSLWPGGLSAFPSMFKITITHFNTTVSIRYPREDEHDVVLQFVNSEFDLPMVALRYTAGFQDPGKLHLAVVNADECCCEAERHGFVDTESIDTFIKSVRRLLCRDETEVYPQCDKKVVPVKEWRSDSLLEMLSCEGRGPGGGAWDVFATLTSGYFVEVLFEKRIRDGPLFKNSYSVRIRLDHFLEGGSNACLPVLDGLRRRALGFKAQVERDSELSLRIDSEEHPEVWARVRFEGTWPSKSMEPPVLYRDFLSNYLGGVGNEYAFVITMTKDPHRHTIEGKMKGPIDPRCFYTGESLEVALFSMAGEYYTAEKAAGHRKRHVHSCPSRDAYIELFAKQSQEKEYFFTIDGLVEFKVTPRPEPERYIDSTYGDVWHKMSQIFDMKLTERDRWFKAVDLRLAQKWRGDALSDESAQQQLVEAFKEVEEVTKWWETAEQRGTKSLSKMTDEDYSEMYKEFKSAHSSQAATLA